MYSVYKVEYRGAAAPKNIKEPEPLKISTGSKAGAGGTKQNF